jgi:hypothetical protein
MEPGHRANCYETSIEGLTFLVCTRAVCDHVTGQFAGWWRAWSFFAFDRSRSIYPGDALPSGMSVQESIAGGFGATEDEARRAVEDRLRRVIRTKDLDGTGF